MSTRSESPEDLDAELLGLAGFDHDDEASEVGEPAQAGRSSSPAKEPSPPHTIKEPTPPTAKRRPIARRITKKPANKRRKKVDSDEEEGEAQVPTAQPKIMIRLTNFRSSVASTPDSHGSAPMIESDSDASGSEDEVFASQPVSAYPVDGIYKSANEKIVVEKMSVLEREEFLANRNDELETARQDRMLLELAQQRNKQQQDSKGKKRKADADADDGPRKASRKTNEHIESYKRAREEATAKRTQLDRRQRDRPSPGAGRDDHFDHEDSADEDTRKTDQPPVLRDFNLIKIGRSVFFDNLYHPQFEKTAIGCFARVHVGMEHGVSKYRLAQIRGFVKGKPTQIEGPNGKIIHTTMWVLVAHAASEKSWPLSTCSNGHITDAELNRYIVTCETENVATPTKAFLREKLNDINNMINQGNRWDGHDFARHRELRAEYDCTPVVEAPEDKLAKTLEAANAIKRRKNIQDTRAAMQMERKKQKAAQMKAARLAEEEERAEWEQEQREKRAKENGGVVSAEDAAASKEKPKEEKKVVDKIFQKQEFINGIPAFAKPSRDDDVLASLDFDIDIEV
ncbi:hypothetical protein K402DRAFT_326074 [Aulographum hederae CBS 113979]|uniref:Plus3 domain-containing protein n=1 Tax=Aulographum hederae CBS 113979 TaxID=1176131 RepID=A0A6G1H9D9_9PEZI|nr:hypothetical protein K402DRAFT_326074 [Aulographum hederae CBS 113979]